MLFISERRLAKNFWILDSGKGSIKQSIDKNNETVYEILAINTREFMFAYTSLVVALEKVNTSAVLLI